MDKVEYIKREFTHQIKAPHLNEKYSIYRSSYSEQYNTKLYVKDGKYVIKADGRVIGTYNNLNTAKAIYILFIDYVLFNNDDWVATLALLCGSMELED